MKLKLNPDQSLIKKISDLPSSDRKSYVASLSEQAVQNVIQHVLHSDKWIYKRDGETDRFINVHLNAQFAYDQITETLSFWKP